VIETLGKVYKNDEIANEQKLSPAERLAGRARPGIRNQSEQVFDLPRNPCSICVGTGVRFGPE
jgi:hypothetical protein